MNKFQKPGQKLKALGINIYGGGFTLGVMRHFNVVAQWEEITLGKRTFDLNFPGFNRPLTRDAWDVDTWRGKVPFVYANPPCAPWSSANTHPGKTKASRFLDPRLALTAHTYEAAVALRPEVFISESVEAGYNIGACHYDQYVELWLKAGYAVTFFLCDAILQGSPSMRRRFHFIAHRSQLQLGAPPALIRATTVGDVLHDLKQVKGQLSHHEQRSLNPHYLELAKLTQPGEPLRKALSRVPGGYQGPGVGFLMKKLKWDRPGFTMVGFQYIHPLYDRWITFREALRLCTYPDTFVAHNAVEAVDAVLPCVAEFLALVAKRTITKNEPCPLEFKLVDWRPLAKKFHINARIS